MISPTREQIIEAMARARAATRHLPGHHEAAEAILAAIAPLAAIVPREATEEQSIVGARAMGAKWMDTPPNDFGRMRASSSYAVMVEAGDISKENAPGATGG